MGLNCFSKSNELLLGFDLFEQLACTVYIFISILYLLQNPQSQLPLSLLHGCVNREAKPRRLRLSSLNHDFTFTLSQVALFTKSLK